MHHHCWPSLLGLCRNVDKDKYIYLNYSYCSSKEQILGLELHGSMYVPKEKFRLEFPCNVELMVVWNFFLISVTVREFNNNNNNVKRC